MAATETADRVRRVATTQRHVEVSKSVHGSATKVGGESGRHSRDGQASLTADNVESKNSVVSITLAKSEESGKHIYRDVDVAPVQNIRDSRVWTRCSTQPVIRSVDYGLIRISNCG